MAALPFTAHGAPPLPPNAEVALDLARQGLAVFPVQASGTEAKKPFFGFRWRHRSTTDEATIVELWSKWPDALPALDLAKCDRLVVDADRHGGPDGVDAWAALATEHSFDEAAHPRVDTPRSGRHFYFRQPAGKPLGNGKKGLPAGIDMRGAGGFVIGPGAVMPDGREYVAHGPAIGDAPPLPAWLLEILSNGAGEADAPADAALPPPPRGTTPVAPDRITAYASAALEEELAKVATAGAGSRNNTLNTAAFALGQMVGAGWISEWEVRQRLVEAARACGLVKDDGISAALKTIASGMRAGRAKPRTEPEDRRAADAAIGAEAARRLIETAAGDLIDEETGEILEDGAPALLDDRDFPESGLHPGGLVGDIADWIMETSPKPIRLFAVAAALATVGTLVGRRAYCGIPRSGTHLYMMTIVGTSGGKDRPQEAIKQLLDLVSSHRFHRGPVSSAASLGVRLKDAPMHIQIIDEVNKVLRRMNNRNSSNQEVALLEDYCTLWGRNTGTYSPESTTVREDFTVVRPWLSIFGATMFAAFYEQLKSRNVANGFYNRFLILPRYERVAFSESIRSDDDVPAELVRACRTLFEFQERPGPATEKIIQPSMKLMLRDTPPPMFVVDMTPAAEALYRACRDRDERMLKASDEDPLLDIWGRASEMTKRIALVSACGRYAPAGLAGVVVDERDMTFARRLVDWSFETLLRDMRENMAENEHQASMKRVLGIIRQAGRIGRSELLRKLDGVLDARTLNSVIEQLLGGEFIAVLTGDTTPKGGRKPTTYVYLKG